jgi:uncharacterized membrane protein (UPF0127 family)
MTESRRNYLFFSVIPMGLLLLYVFTNSDCGKEQKQNLVVDTTKKKLQEIPFVRQGEVYFQDKNKKLIKQIDVEIADTDEKRHRGLMFRTKMDSSQGMLFIFPEEDEQAFYMKNTIISLDIIFINSKKQIVKIYKNTKPFDLTDLPSKRPILYVVEVNAGFTEKHGIKEGDYIDFRRM